MVVRQGRVRQRGRWFQGQDECSESQQCGGGFLYPHRWARTSHAGCLNRVLLQVQKWIKADEGFLFNPTAINQRSHTDINPSQTSCSRRQWRKRTCGQPRFPQIHADDPVHEPQHWHVPGSHGIIIGLLNHCLGESRDSPTPPPPEPKTNPTPTRQMTMTEGTIGWIFSRKSNLFPFFFCKQIHRQENRNRSVLQ